VGFPLHSGLLAYTMTAVPAIAPAAPRNNAVAAALFRLLPRLYPPHWLKVVDSFGESIAEPRGACARSSARSPRAVSGLPLYIRRELTAGGSEHPASLANSALVHCV